jgi:hypothetical protein
VTREERLTVSRDRARVLKAKLASDKDQLSDRPDMADLARSEALIADQKRMSSKSAEDVIRGRRDRRRQAGGLAAAC